MTNEEILSNLSTLESQLNDNLSVVSGDKEATKLMRIALRQIPVARQGINALINIESILKGIEKWLTLNYK